ncbi:MAG TPA: hypothetical protein VFC19_39165 [Candidatus Limnocylindrales bacterium]|nr:hypothetical protein [Candidatus Limnocylindrales bacterium]
MSKARNLDLQMLREARKANKIQLIVGVVSVVALVLSGIAIFLQLKGDRKSDPDISAEICAGWLIRDGITAIADCPPSPVGARLEDAIIFTIFNSGKSGTTLISAAVRCLDGATCDFTVTKIQPGPAQATCSLHTSTRVPVRA